MSKRVYAAALLLAVFSLFLVSCSGGGTNGPGPTLPKPLAERYAIDGVVDLAAVGTVMSRLSISLILSAPDPSSKRLLSGTRWPMNERHLYIALEWTDATPNAFDPAIGLTDFDGVVVMFDNNGNGTFEANETPAGWS